jgi:flavin reductase (DIM6/NTAB) family NADH-FMN oxidoreductase RutF
MESEALFFGTKTGRDVDKLDVTGCKTEPATKIDSVILSDATANFECELETEIPIGDHILFVGKVVASHMNAEPTKRLYTIAKGGKMGPAS